MSLKYNSVLMPLCGRYYHKERRLNINTFGLFGFTDSYPLNNLFNVITISNCKCTVTRITKVK